MTVCDFKLLVLGKYLNYELQSLQKKTLIFRTIYVVIDCINRSFYLLLWFSTVLVQRLVNLYKNTPNYKPTTQSQTIFGSDAIIVFIHNNKTTRLSFGCLLLLFPFTLVVWRHAENSVWLQKSLKRFCRLLSPVTWIVSALPVTCICIYILFTCLFNCSILIWV